MLAYIPAPWILWVSHSRAKNKSWVLSRTLFRGAKCIFGTPDPADYHQSSCTSWFAHKIAIACMDTTGKSNMACWKMHPSMNDDFPIWMPVKSARISIATFASHVWWYQKAFDFLHSQIITYNEIYWLSSTGQRLCECNFLQGEVPQLL